MRSIPVWSTFAHSKPRFDSQYRIKASPKLPVILEWRELFCTGREWFANVMGSREKTACENLQPFAKIHAAVLALAVKLEAGTREQAQGTIVVLGIVGGFRLWHGLRNA